MNEYGGYFGLEKNIITEKNRIDFSHYFKSARSIINFILKEMKCNRIYLPYFFCDVILEGVVPNDVLIEFYHINTNLEIARQIDLSEGELLLYINYFGLKRAYCKKLSNKYGSSLLIDNVQDYFDDFAYNSISFNSARKYFGVPDGANLFIPDSYQISNSKLKP